MTISIKDTFIHGLRNIFHNLRFVILLWGTNALSALILTVPLYYVLIEDLNRSLISEYISQKFDYLWYIQFHYNYKTTVGELPIIIYSVVGIYTLIQTFYLGGLISVFNTPSKNHMVDFFYGGVKYWFRFTKVLLISLVFFAGAFLLNDFLGDVIADWFRDSENELLVSILRSLRYVLLIFIIGLITIVSDYAKTYIAIKDSTRLLHSIYSALAFIKKNFWVVFIVFLIVASVGAAGAVIYNFIGKEIPRTPFYFLALSFILQQMLIIFRLIIRMLFCSTEVLLFKDLSADILNPAVN